MVNKLNESRVITQRSWYIYTVLRHLEIIKKIYKVINEPREKTGLLGF